MGIRELTIALVLPITIALNANPQEPAPSADLLVRFDNEHDLAKKERLLQEITANHVGVGPALLRVAEFTKNSDTRWMAMRGMSTVHCIDCAPFLESSLKSPNALVRANAARSLGDLRLTASGPKILAMFVAEKDPGTIEQASLALRVLDIREAVPFIRTKIPQYTWQTRGWLLQALGTLGGPTDVPLIGGYSRTQKRTISTPTWVSARSLARWWEWEGYFRHAFALLSLESC